MCYYQLFIINLRPTRQSIIINSALTQFQIVRGPSTSHSFLVFVTKTYKTCTKTYKTSTKHSPTPEIDKNLTGFDKI